MPIKIASKFIPRELLAERLPNAIRFLKRFDSLSEEIEIIDESPIFLFSAGWRSGSTLLQRLVCSDKSVLIWGEPYGDRIPVPRLAAAIADFHANDSTIKYAIELLNGEMSEEWIANLNPGPQPLREAHIAYFENLFAKQARMRGYQRWGAKWVRLSAYYAYYLQWLYPQARFVFLVRNPIAAWRSYKGKQWFSIKPNFRVNSVIKFMSFWNYLTSSFIAEYKNLNAMIIRYEDIISNEEAVGRLSEFTGIRIDRDVLQNKVGSRGNKKLRVSLFDRLVCSIMTSGVSYKLGYDQNPRNPEPRAISSKGIKSDVNQ